MITRRIVAVGCAALALSVLFGLTNSAVAGHTAYVYQGQRLHFAGEPQMIAAINAIGRAMAFPRASEAHVHAAELQLNAALRFVNNPRSQRDLNGALQMLNAFRYRGDHGALVIARQRTEWALAEAQHARVGGHTVYHPVLPQPYPPVVYPPAYPVPLRNQGLTISKGAFSITIPLGR